MKIQTIYVTLLLFTVGCTGQKISDNNNNLKNDTMEYFDINRYKDWELDPNYTSSETDKFLMKGNERVKIIISKAGIGISYKENINSPYEYIYTYYLNNIQENNGVNFYENHIGIWSLYDEIGRLSKKIDMDKPYNFSMKDVIEKIKKDYGVDLEDKKQGGSVYRFQSEELNKQPFYEVLLKAEDEYLKMNYILIDGDTGKTLYKTDFYLKGNNRDLFQEYLEIRNTPHAFYREYKGRKFYSEEEWRKFADEFTREYAKKKNIKLEDEPLAAKGIDHRWFISEKSEK